MVSILHFKLHTHNLLHYALDIHQHLSNSPSHINSNSFLSQLMSSRSLPSSIMALQITSATTLSSTSSFGCIDNFPKLPSSVHTRPSKSSFIQSSNNLLSPLSSYPLMSHPKINHKYTPIDSLYLPQCWPSPPYRLGEDISRTGAGTRYIRIMAQDLALVYISLRQDGILLHYSQPCPLDDIIELETCNVLRRCMRVGRAAQLLWKEIILLFKACAPQWSGRWWWRNIWRVCQKYKAAEEE